MRGKLIIGGFFGRGNCGDEALLQCVYEAFSDVFDITILVDEVGAKEGFWDLYPYNESKNTHISDINIFTDKLTCGFHIGGGGLPIGVFGMHAMNAKAFNIPIAITGIEAHGIPVNNEKPTERQKSIFNVNKHYLSLFDYVSFRNNNGIGDIEGLGSLSSNHGADWALRLETDVNENIISDKHRAVVVVREYELKDADAKYIQKIKDKIRMIQLAGFKPVLAPFSPEDISFANFIGISEEWPMVELWSNARMMQQYIKESGLMISFGRLHPGIFAANVETPCAFVMPHYYFENEDFDMKLIGMATELGITMIDNDVAFAKFLRKPRRADKNKVLLSKKRLEEQIKTLRKIFIRESKRKLQLLS